MCGRSIPRRVAALEGSRDTPLSPQRKALARPREKQRAALPLLSPCHRPIRIHALYASPAHACQENAGRFATAAELTATP